MLTKFSTVMVVVALFCLAQTQSPPIWPDQFTVDFYEVALLITKGTTRGTIYYDAKNNREVITRDSGSHDRYCGTVFKFQDTPCNHIVVNSTTFYIQTKDILISLKSNTAACVVMALKDAESFVLTG